MIRFLGAVLALFFGGVTVDAQEKTFGKGDLWVYGVGTQTCGTYLKVRDEERRIGSTIESVAYLNWLGGFLSGVNKAHSSGNLSVVLRPIHMDGHLAWLEKYCRERPLDYVFSGAEALYYEIVSRAASTKH